MRCSNTYNFDITENYMALLACILTELSVDECISIVTLQNRRNKRRKHRKQRAEDKSRYKETYIFDIETKEMHKFENGKKAAQYVGLNPNAIGCYVSN